MKKIVLLIAILILVSLGLIGNACKSADARGTNAARRFDVPADRLKALQEVVKTAEAVQTEAKQKREQAAAALSPAEKKIVEAYQAKLAEIAKAEQGQINGLQILLNSHGSEIKLQFSKEGKLPLADVDKFTLQRKADGGWELADAPPLPLPLPPEKK